MPTYVYRFVDTGETIEVQQAFTDDALTQATHPGTGEVMAVKKVFTPVGVTFKDNTTISVGPDTKLAVDEFVFAPEQERYGMKTRMLQGTMYYVSGTIAKLAPESVSVTTPVGTIGIRGTRFLVKADAPR